MEDFSAGAARSVRPERPGDEAGVRAVTEAAFPTAEEAQLVDRLRADRTAWLPGLSWVAVDDAGRIIAHSLLTRCQVGGAAATALAPCSVDPAQQHRGVGSAVIRAYLAAAVERGEDLVLVLGHPELLPAVRLRTGLPVGDPCTDRGPRRGHDGAASAGRGPRSGGRHPVGGGLRDPGPGGTVKAGGRAGLSPAGCVGRSRR